MIIKINPNSGININGNYVTINTKNIRGDYFIIKKDKQGNIGFLGMTKWKLFWLKLLRL